MNFLPISLASSSLPTFSWDKDPSSPRSFRFLPSAGNAHPPTLHQHLTLCNAFQTCMRALGHTTAFVVSLLVTLPLPPPHCITITSLDYVFFVLPEPSKSTSLVSATKYTSKVGLFSFCLLSYHHSSSHQPSPCEDIFICSLALLPSITLASSSRQE